MRMYIIDKVTDYSVLLSVFQTVCPSSVSSLNACLSGHLFWIFLSSGGNVNARFNFGTDNPNQTDELFIADQLEKEARRLLDSGIQSVSAATVGVDQSDLFSKYQTDDVHPSVQSVESSYQEDLADEEFDQSGN